MKTITLIIMLFTIGFSGNKPKSRISSNYDCSIIINNGRCTGSAYCSACSNCSRCAHCSNGGTCGVCRGSSSNNFYSAPKKRTTKRLNTTNYYKPVQESRIFYANEEIIIYKEKINLRELPSTESKIIERVSYGQTVIFIQEIKDWSKVKVEETGTIGYIYSKLLND